jgi:polysaccharide export outer membrane protein
MIINSKLFKKAAILFGMCAIVFCMATGCTPDRAVNGNGKTTDPTTIPASGAESVSDKLQVNDLITIAISGVGRSSGTQSARISEDGTIKLMLIGDYQAAGKTISQIQDELTQAYSKYYTEFVITVSSEARFFYITGEVRMPGKSVYTPGLTFTRAIAIAGGYSTFASRTKVRVTNADGKTRKVNANKIEKDPSKDFLILPGDIITVPKR